MTDHSSVATWLRGIEGERSSEGPLMYDNQFRRDLANLCAQQHEALRDAPLVNKHAAAIVAALRAAGEFQEKYDV